ncbi:MAG: DUF2911 domain-containing protein [Pyrinomonadaceae bacterium]|nr:DUF2911 domain-containing protein [Sphingobacteriaceae bacterium]
MKKLLAIVALTAAVFVSTPTWAQQQDSVKKMPPKERKRMSPKASVTETMKNGTVISINYSQPYLKNRTIGKDIAPFEKVWRTGADEATTFEVSKDVKLENMLLPAGKYSLYTIPGEKEWTIIFNKSWNQWGTVYKQDLDQLRVKVKPENSNTSTEMLTYLISKAGDVSINWGKVKVEFDID